MKKIISALLLLCVIVGSLTSCIDPASNDLQLVSSENEIFELYVPKTWVSNLSSGVASAYASFEDKVLVSARTSNDFRGYSLDEFMTIAIKSYEEMKGYNLINGASATTLGGKAAYTLEFEAQVTETIKFVPTAVTYRFRVVIAQNESYFVTLSYCAPAKNFDKALADFDRIVGEFVFKQVETDPEGFILTSSDKEIFKLYVPSTWISNLSSGTASAYAPKGSNVIVSARTVREAKNYTLGEFMSLTVKSYEKLDGYELVTATAEVELGGKEAAITEYKATVTETVDNKTVKTVYKFMSIVAKYDATFTLFTYCAPEADYELNLADVDVILSKFEFKSFEDGEIEKDDFMDTTTNAPEGYQVASNDKYEFIFYVPITWTVQRRTYNPKAYYSLTDLSNVTVNTYKADEDIYDGKTFWEDYTARTSFAITDVVIDENAKMGGHNAYTVEYTETISSNDYKIKQAFLSVNSLIYVITYTSTPANYAKHLDDVNKMIEMFELK